MQVSKSQYVKRGNEIKGNGRKGLISHVWNNISYMQYVGLF